jgi:hypothetical protein
LLAFLGWFFLTMRRNLFGDLEVVGRQARAGVIVIALLLGIPLGLSAPDDRPTIRSASGLGRSAQCLVAAPGPEKGCRKPRRRSRGSTNQASLVDGGAIGRTIASRSRHSGSSPCRVRACDMPDFPATGPSDRQRSTTRAGRIPKKPKRDDVVHHHISGRVASAKISFARIGQRIANRIGVTANQMDFAALAKGRGMRYDFLRKAPVSQRNENA